MKVSTIVLFFASMLVSYAQETLEPVINLVTEGGKVFLNISVRNNSDKEVFLFTPPWRGGTALILLPIIPEKIESCDPEFWTGPFTAAVASKDFSPVLLKPQSTEGGRIALDERFPRFSERNREEKVVLFWSVVLYFDFKRKISDPPLKTDARVGYIKILSQTGKN